MCFFPHSHHRTCSLTVRNISMVRLGTDCSLETSRSSSHRRGLRSPSMAHPESITMTLRMWSLLQQTHAGHLTRTLNSSRAAENPAASFISWMTIWKTLWAQKKIYGKLGSYAMPSVLVVSKTVASGGSRGGGGGAESAAAPPFFRPIFFFWPIFVIFGRGIEEFGFPPPPPLFTDPGSTSGST